MTPEEESLIETITHCYKVERELDEPGLLKAVVTSGVSKNQEDAWEFVEKWKREGIKDSFFYKRTLFTKVTSEGTFYKVGKKLSFSSLYSLFRKT